MIAVDDLNLGMLGVQRNLIPGVVGLDGVDQAAQIKTGLRSHKLPLTQERVPITTLPDFAYGNRCVYGVLSGSPGASLGIPIVQLAEATFGPLPGVAGVTIR